MLKVSKNRPTSVMMLIQLILVFSLAQLGTAQSSYHLRSPVARVPSGNLTQLIHGFLFSLPSVTSTDSVAMAASQFSTNVTSSCDIQIDAIKFNGTSTGQSFISSTPNNAFCVSTYDNTVAYQKFRQSIVYLTVNATYGTGINVTSVNATGDVQTPVNTESNYTAATDILDLPTTDKIFLFRRQPYYTYQIVAVAATGGLTPSQVYYPLNTAGLTQPSVQTLASMQNFVLISLSDSTGASQLHILNSTGANASLANVLPEIILTDTNYRAYYITVDNINSDHIYCTFYKSATEFKVAAFSVSTLSSNTTVAAAITTQSGTYATFSSLLRFVNMGTLNFLIGVSVSQDDKVYLYAKTLSNFGQTLTQQIYLPTTNPEYKKIGESSAYGVFDIQDMTNAVTTAFIYHGSDDFKANIITTLIGNCSSGTTIYNVTSDSCTADTTPMDGYYNSITGKTWLPCATSRCQSCNTTSYDHCDTCVTASPAHNNVDFTCVSCAVANCVQCTSDDACDICLPGYTGVDCATCKPGYQTIGGECRQPCNVTNCTTCLRNDGSTCETCATGRTGPICAECDGSANYSSQMGDCRPTCGIANCDKCLNSTACDICNDLWNGTDCLSCKTGSTFQNVTSKCEYDCTNLTGCNYCHQNNSCKNCRDHFEESATCNTCEGN